MQPLQSIMSIQFSELARDRCSYRFAWWGHSMKSSLLRMKHFWAVSVGSGLACLGLLLPFVGAAPLPNLDLAKLKIIPDSAGAVVVVRGVEGVKGRLFSFLKKAVPEYAGLAQTMTDLSLSGGLDGRKLEGMAANGPIFVILPSLKEKDLTGEIPNVTVVAAITDYAKFRDGLLKPNERKELKKEGGLDVVQVAGHSTFMAEKDGFAVLAPSREGVEFVLKSKASLDAKVSPAISARLAGADVALFVNFDQALKDYAEQLKEAESSAADFLKSAAEALPKEQKASFEMMQSFIKPTFQALRDSSGMVFSLNFAPEGALFRVEVEARKGTDSAKFINSIGVSAFEGLAKQVAGQVFYTGFVGGEAINKLTETFTKSLKTDANADEIKKLVEAMALLAKAGPGETNSTMDLPLTGITITKYKDPQAAMAAQLQSLEIMGPGSLYGGGGIKDFKITKDAVTHQGTKFTRAVFSWDFAKMFGNGQELPEEVQKQIVTLMKELMGEKMEVYLGIENGESIQLTAPNWDKAKKLLESYKTGKAKVGAVENYTAVRKGMSDRQTMVVLLDPVRYGGKVVEIMKGAFAGMLPIPPGFPANLDKANPSYLGFGVALDQNNAAMEWFISSAAINECFKTFVKPFLTQ